LVRLDNPDKLLNGVVEVELDLVSRGTNRLITSELELSNEVLMGILGKSTALISVEENIVNIERSSDERLVIGDSSASGFASSIIAVKGGDGPETLINRTNIEVNFDFVILHITILPHLSVYLCVSKGLDYILDLQRC
jgi:hypothetical protein